TFENVRNLLLARSEAHPDGIGNDRQQVARNYTYQLNQTPVRGRWPEKKFQFYMGNGCTIPQIHAYNGDNFDHTDLDFVGGARIQAEGGQREPISSVGDLFAGFEDRQWGAAWKQALREDWDSVGGVSIEGDSPAYEGNFLDLDPTYT